MPSSIQGTGEMADRIRSYDWARTTLGPLSEWSETLVTAVNLILFSPFPQALYWGPELVLLYNDHYRPFLSLKNPTALGSSASVIWAEAWDVLEEPLMKAFNDGESLSARGQKIPILINGVMEDRWWTYGLNPVFQAGKIAGVANPVVEDTAAILSDQELRRGREELRTSLDAASLGTWHYDPSTGVVVADERMKKIYQLLGHDGKLEDWITFLHVEDRERVLEHFNGVLAGKHDYEVEYRIRLPEGELCWVRSKGKMVGREGDPERFFAVIEDITERKRTEAALHQTEKLAAVGRLSASIAHEINNPLEAVTNLLYLARGSESLEQVQEYLETAERELRRVSIISSQTLRFYKQSTLPKAVHCEDLFQSVLSIYHGRIVNSRIQLEKRKRANKAVECFDGEIRQVLNNLVGNAIDAMHPGGGRLFLRSRESYNRRLGKHGLTLTVADTGGGMPPSVMKKAFEAFFTTKGIGGTGLGLWVSHEIIARHNGALRLRSSQKEGHSGTVFTVFLPFDAVKR